MLSRHRRRDKAAALQIHLLAAVAVYWLLLCSHQVSADISATFTTATAINAYTWTLSEVTQGAGSLVVNRGEPVRLEYSTTVSYALSSSVGTLQGSISVTVGGACNPSGNSSTLTGLQIVVGSAAPVTVSGGGVCNPTCTNLGFGPISVSQARLPAPGVTQMTVTALWNGNQDPGCPAAVVPISWGSTSTTRGTATISQSPSWPQWNTYFVSTWLNTAPTTTVTGTGTLIATAPATTTINAVGDSGTFDYAWTWTVDNILFCLAPTTVGMTVQLKADDFSTSQSTSSTIEVQGCNRPVTLDLSDIRTQTSLTFAWSQNIVPTGSSSIQVPWGGGGSVPARGTFSRTVTSATFALTMNIQLTNPERGPTFINNLQLMCLWGPTINLPCGTGFNSAAGVVGATGTTGFVIPASQTINCPINNLAIPGSWGVDFRQPCRIVATTFWGRVTEFSQLTLDFSSPIIFTRINDCALWSVSCSQPTGNPRWQPVVSGGPSSLRICGTDTNAAVPDQTFSIAFSGGWIGSGDQPGDCSSPVTATCTSQLVLQNSGAAIGTSGGGQSASLTVTAVPTNCPTPAPPPAPGTPAPSPAPPDSSLFSNNGIAATIRVTGTSIQGSFGWDIESSVSPATQSLALGSTGKTTYNVRVVRENSDDAEPVRYIINGEIQVTNSNSRRVGIATVSAVLDDAKVPATCPTSLPAQMDPGASMTCTFRLQYNRQTTPGLLDAEVVQTDTAVRVAAQDQAPFTFAEADTSEASAACASVKMTFAANAGMNLQKLADVGSPVLPVDGQTVRVCGTTDFRFDVEVAPSEPLNCGTQPVVSTAVVTPDNESSGPVRQAVTTANIAVTGCSGFSESPDDDDDVVSDAGDADTGGSDGVTVTLGTISTAAVDRALWALRIVPVGVSNGVVAKARDEELADGLKFRMTYTKRSQRMTQYSGNLTIVNGGNTPITVDSVSVELVDRMSPLRAVVAQINVACPNEVTPSAPLNISANAEQTCSFALSAQMGGEISATISVVELGDSVQSKPEVVSSFLAASNENECATLISGLGASSLLSGGKMFVDGSLEETEVCSSGSKELTFSLGSTPNAPCGTWPFLTLARLVPDNSSTSSPVTSSASVDIQLTGCSDDQKSLGLAEISRFNTFKSRIMKWSVRETASPAIEGSTMVYEPDGDNTVSVSVLYSRQFEGGTTLSLNGVVGVEASEDPPSSRNKKMLVVPLCVNGQACSPSEVDLTCGSTVNSGSLTCRFNRHRLPVASGVLMPLMRFAEDDQLAYPAKVTVYDPNTSNGRRTFGRCAVLTDEQSITAPARVAKLNEVNAPGKDPVCSASWLHTYKLRFSGVSCDGGAYDFTSQAKATPADGVAAVASGRLSFSVSC